MDYKPDFLITPYQLIADEDLTPIDERIYSVIYYFSKMRDEKCTALNRSIADVAKVKTKTVKNSLTKLEKKGYIKRTYKTDNRNERLEVIPMIAFTFVKKEGGVTPQGRGVGNTRDGHLISNSNKDINKKNNKKKKVLDKFFNEKDWDDVPEITRKKFRQDAEELLEIASLQEISDAIATVSKWADNNNLNWNLSTVIKKWSELDSLKEKDKPYYKGDKMVKKDGDWFVIDKTGDWFEFAGDKDDIEWK